MLFTALEANPDVPRMEVVTERLVHDERKQRNKENNGSGLSKVLAVTRSKGALKSFHSVKPGHFK